MRSRPPRTTRTISTTRIGRLCRGFQQTTLRSATQRLHHRRSRQIQSRIRVLGVTVSGVSIDSFLTRLRRNIIFAPGISRLVGLRGSRSFIGTCSGTSFQIYSDRILLVTSGFLNHPVRTGVSKSSLFPLFYRRRHRGRGVGVFLLKNTRKITTRTRAHVGTHVNQRVVIRSRSPSFKFRGGRSRYRHVLSVVHRSPTGILIMKMNTPGRRG